MEDVPRFMVQPSEEITLAMDKKAQCCGLILQAGQTVKVFKRLGPRKLLIGIPYNGTYSLHKIRLRCRGYLD